MATQKVVIPKGLVNPNETTVIEIPQGMQNLPAVIAVRRNDYGNASGGCPGAQRERNYPQQQQSDYSLGNYSEISQDYPSYAQIPQTRSYMRAQSRPPPSAGQRQRTCGGNDESTEAGIKQVLEKMEHIELTKIQKDLRDFQTARRKLIFDATNMAPPKLGCGARRK